MLTLVDRRASRLLVGGSKTRSDGHCSGAERFGRDRSSLVRGGQRPEWPRRALGHVLDQGRRAIAVAVSNPEARVRLASRDGARRESDGVEQAGRVIGVVVAITLVGRDVARNDAAGCVVLERLGIAEARFRLQSPDVVSSRRTPPGPATGSFGFATGDETPQQVIARAERAAIGVGPGEQFLQRIAGVGPRAGVGVAPLRAKAVQVVGAARNRTDRVFDADEVAECVVVESRRAARRRLRDEPRTSGHVRDRRARAAQGIDQRRGATGMRDAAAFDQCSRRIEQLLASEPSQRVIGTRRVAGA